MQGEMPSREAVVMVVEAGGVMEGQAVAGEMVAGNMVTGLVVVGLVVVGRMEGVCARVASYEAQTRQSDLALGAMAVASTIR